MKSCKNCQYWREHSAVSVDIPGSGNWCSNSKSGNYKKRMSENGSCDKFIQRGKKAPLWMRGLKNVLKRREK